MKAPFLLVAFAAVVAFFQPEANAQTMDVSAFVTSPQSGEVGLEGRTFGYGFGATYALTQAHPNVHPVGTIQYHNHSRAEYRESGLELIEGGDRDFWAGGGIRVTKWNLYVQGLAGFIQKRDTFVDRENDTKIAGYVGWGVQPGMLGIAGGWYFSDFGTQYGAGFALRF